MKEWLLQLHSYLRSYWLFIAVNGGRVSLLVEDGCREDVHAPGNDLTLMCIWAALTGLTGLLIRKSKQKEAMKLGGRGNKEGLL